MPDTVKADLAYNNAYWAQFQDSVVQTVSNQVYDGLLKAYGDERGIQSYGTVVIYWGLLSRFSARKAIKITGQRPVISEVNGNSLGDCCNPPRLSFLLNQGRHPGRSVRCDSDPARLKIIAPRDPQCLTECYHAYWLPSPKERRTPMPL